MTRIGLKHLIGIVAAASFVAIVFGTFGVLVAYEVKQRAEWQQVQDGLLRGVPAYLGKRREAEEEP